MRLITKIKNRQPYSDCNKKKTTGTQRNGSGKLQPKYAKRKSSVFVLQETPDLTACGIKPHVLFFQQ